MIGGIKNCTAKRSIDKQDKGILIILQCQFFFFVVVYLYPNSHLLEFPYNRVNAAVFAYQQCHKAHTYQDEHKVNSSCSDQLS